ncbi:MAG: Dyp-type peroxidase [Chromatiaceae bacterium]|nr:Dyp-type peroxidase [Chromatiaceae bacterium]
MAREQLGICAEANLHGSYLLLNALEGQEKALRYKLARIPQLFDRLADHFSEALLTGVVAVGSNYWDLLYPDARPALLHAFPEPQDDNIGLAAVPVDLLLQIRSDRLDVNVIAAQQVLQLLQGHVDVLDALQGFRYLDGRQLTGFIDTPYNPKARQKRQIALVDAAKQPLFAGGSYLYFQQLGFNQTAWQRLTQPEQEAILGFEKVSGRLLADERLSADSHAALMWQQDNDSAVLHQNMPFYQLKQQGLLQLQYAASAEALQQQLTRRLGLGAAAAGHDLLLNYHRFELSAAFFAPSISFLELAASGDV